MSFEDIVTLMQNARTHKSDAELVEWLIATLPPSTLIDALIDAKDRLRAADDA